jgi:hypothetical protein
MRITSREAIRRNMTPLEVWDNTGQMVRRHVIFFDTETGEVRSLQFSKKGETIINPFTGNPAVRREKFPAPLTWKKVTQQQADIADKCLWDFEEGEWKNGVKVEEGAIKAKIQGRILY